MMNVESDTPAPAMRPSPPKSITIVLNALISVLLRSPLHRLLSDSTLILSFTGRKSGKIYTFPVGYYQLKRDTLTLIPLHGWWKNLRSSVPITIWLKGRKYSGTAEAFQGDEATINELQQLIAGSANLMRVYMIERDTEGNPDAEHISQVARSLPLVHIKFTIR
jgi:hypothetical protein